MVDCGGLENRCTLTGTVGSNPTASANNPSEVIYKYPSLLQKSPSLGIFAKGSDD